MDRATIIKSAIKNIQSQIAEGEKKQKSDSLPETWKQLTSHNKITLVKKQKNIRHRITSLLPNIESNYIYEIFGFLGINQKAIEVQNFDESFVNTHFFGKNIRKVQIGKNAVIIDFSASEFMQNQLPIYKSKGNNHFNEIAELIHELYHIFTEFKMEDQTAKYKSISFNKTLESLGNDMFICTNGVSKFAISKSLLTYLEYDIEEFAIEAVKYHSIFAEFFSAKQYVNVVKHLINTIKYRVQFSQGLIDLEQFKELTTMTITDFAYSKTGVKSYCNSTVFILNVEYLVHRVDQIHYRSDQITLAIESCSLQHKQIENEKSQIQQRQFNIIKNLKLLPPHLLHENKSRMVNYKTIDPTLQQPVSEKYNDKPHKNNDSSPEIQ